MSDARQSGCHTAFNFETAFEWNQRVAAAVNLRTRGIMAYSHQAHAVAETTGNAYQLILSTGRPFEILTLAAAIYAVIDGALLTVQSYAERRLLPTKRPAEHPRKGSNAALRHADFR